MGGIWKWTRRSSTCSTATSTAARPEPADHIINIISYYGGGHDDACLPSCSADCSGLGAPASVCLPETSGFPLTLGWLEPKQRRLHLKAQSMTVSPALRAAALESKAWPFEEARKILKRVEKSGKKNVLFETGYGPSGLPHIGTFGEVARTTMVRRAFEMLSDLPRACSASRTTWTACARFRTMCRTASLSRICTSR
jgi:hypothetical protein